MNNHNLNTNILFVVLDSCRYDSALAADTPNLNSVGKLKRAETSATFTYPAHHAFFIGNLPRILDDEFYFENYNQIWRSGNARETKKNVFLQFEGKSIIGFYEKAGFNVAGFGGVSFFNTTQENNTLPTMFKKFTFFGDNKDLPPDRKAPRKPRTLTLNNLEQITKEFSEDNPFMVFVNVNETHIPYDTPNQVVDEDYLAALTKLYLEHYSQRANPLDGLPLSHEQIQLFKSAQIKAVEWCDEQIGKLLAYLPKSSPTLIIVCGDHGDEFGEGGRFGHAHYHETVMYVPMWTGVVNK